MVTPLFRGIFGQAKDLFCGNFENYLKIVFILVNIGVSGDVSIQMPTKCHYLKLISQLGVKVVYFTKNAPH
jgi:hypothetical protein